MTSKITHERVQLSIDLDLQSLKGLAELTFKVLYDKDMESEMVDEGDEDRIRTIFVNCRQSNVSVVSVRIPGASGEEIPTSFDMRNNYLDEDLCPPGSIYQGTVEKFREKWRQAALVASEGEMAVTISPGIIKKLIDADSWWEPRTKYELSEAESGKKFLKVHIRIYYELVQPAGGAHFIAARSNPVGGASSSELHYPAHMYTSVADGGTRLWLPCVDTLKDPITWDLEYRLSGEDTFIVSSGEVVDINTDGGVKIMKYKIDAPTLPCNIGLCAGPFEVNAVETGPNLPKWITYFYLPGRARAMRHTTAFVPESLEFFKEYFQVDQFPYDSLTLTFVEGMWDDTATYSTSIVANGDLLHTDRIIDRTMSVRSTLARAVARTWFGCLRSCATWSDYWLVEGISGYLAMCFMRHKFGENEFKYWLLSEMDAVMELDTTNVSLYPEDPDPLGYPVGLREQLIRIKAPLVFYLIEKKIGADALQSYLCSLVKRDESDDGGEGGSGGGGDIDTGSSSQGPGKSRSHAYAYLNSLSHSRPIKTKATFDEIFQTFSVDLTNMSAEFVFGSGIPRFECGFRFNRKERKVLFAVRQSNAEGVIFRGPLTIRVMEADGVFDHVLELRETHQMHELEYHGSVRRKSTVATQKSMKKRDRDPEEDNVNLALDEAAVNVLGTPVLWVRIDPEIDWLRTIAYQQPEAFWVNQLRRDIDVVAQRDALYALTRWKATSPHHATIKTLENTLRNPRMFYRVRIEAARALAEACNVSVSVAAQGMRSFTAEDEEKAWAPLESLIEYYKCHYYTAKTTVRAQNFVNFNEYYVQKAVLHAISTIRNDKNQTMTDIVHFLVEVMKEHDNSSNSYSDVYFLAAAIRAVAHVRSGDAEQHGLAGSAEKRALRQIQRYMKQDTENPSHRRVVMAAALLSYTELAVAGSLSVEKVLSELRKYIKPEEHLMLLLTALRCVLYLGFHGVGRALSARGLSLDDIVTGMGGEVEFGKAPTMRDSAICAIEIALNIATLPSSVCTPNIRYLALRSILAPVDLAVSGDSGDHVLGGNIQDIEFRAHINANLARTRHPPDHVRLLRGRSVAQNPSSMILAKKIWRIITHESRYDNRLREAACSAFEYLFGSHVPCWDTQK